MPQSHITPREIQQQIDHNESPSLLKLQVVAEIVVRSNADIESKFEPFVNLLFTRISQTDASHRAPRGALGKAPADRQIQDISLACRYRGHFNNRTLSPSLSDSSVNMPAMAKSGSFLRHRFQAPGDCTVVDHSIPLNFSLRITLVLLPNAAVHYSPREFTMRKEFRWG